MSPRTASISASTSSLNPVSDLISGIATGSGSGSPVRLIGLATAFCTALGCDGCSALSAASLCEPIATFRTGAATGTGGSSVTVGAAVAVVETLSAKTSVAGASDDAAGATVSGEEDATSEGAGEI